MKTDPVLMQLKWPMLKDSVFKEHYKIPFENVDFNSSGLHLAILKTNPPLLGRKCLLEDQQSHQPTYTDICSAHQILSLIWVEIV